MTPPGIEGRTSANLTCIGEASVNEFAMLADRREPERIDSGRHFHTSTQTPQTATNASIPGDPASRTPRKGHDAGQLAADLADARQAVQDALAAVGPILATALANWYERSNLGELRITLARLLSALPPSLPGAEPPAAQQAQPAPEAATPLQDAPGSPTGAE